MTVTPPLSLRPCLLHLLLSIHSQKHREIERHCQRQCTLTTVPMRADAQRSIETQLRQLHREQWRQFRVYEHTHSSYNAARHVHERDDF
jgi:hypothetical protein